jgi:hypothetical protein
VVILTMLSVFTKEKVSSNANCFELLGFGMTLSIRFLSFVSSVFVSFHSLFPFSHLADILLTDNLEAKLVEVNLGPSLSVTSEVDVYVKQVRCYLGSFSFFFPSCDLSL